MTPAPRRRRQPVAVNPSPVPVMVRRLLRNARLYLHLARLEAASVAAVPRGFRCDHMGADILTTSREEAKS